MEFSFHEGKKLLSLVCNEETLLYKKRRWLQSKDISGLKFKRKRPKFLSEKYVPESLVRSDEVSCENVKSSVEKCFGSLSNNQFKHHVVKNSFNPLMVHHKQNNEKAISYITTNLSNEALYSIAKIITSNDPQKFKKTQSSSIKIIKTHFVNFVSDPTRNSQNFNLVSEILQNPCNYLRNSTRLVTPITKELKLSINKTLESLDEMQYQDLVAISRIQKGVNATSGIEFPPVIRASGTMKNLLDRVGLEFDKSVLGLEIGDELPRNFAKALTIVILSLNYRLGRTSVPIYEFYPFSEKVLYIRNEILKALRLVDKLRSDKLKPLRPILDPNDKISRTSFRISLRKYLIECLFFCDDINIPEQAMQAINLINGTNSMKLGLFSEETRDKEVESVLNVSCYFKSVVSNLISTEEDKEFEKESDELNPNGFFENNDFEFGGTNYFFNSDNQELGVQVYGGSCSNIIGSNYENNESNLTGGLKKKNRDEMETPVYDGVGRSGMEIELNEEKKRGSEIELNEICDEMALVAHELIGNVIDGFLQIDNRNVDESTKNYLVNGSSRNHDNFEGGKGKLKISQEKHKANVLVSSLENVLPSLPKSCLEKVKRLMGQ